MISRNKIAIKRKPDKIKYKKNTKQMLKENLINPTPSNLLKDICILMAL